MVRPGNPELLERLRALADPQRYQQQLSEQRTAYIQRAEQLLIERDFNDGDPNMNERDKELVLKQIDEALVSLDWRIQEADESIAAFTTGQQAGMNRKQRRKLLKDKDVRKAAGAASSGSVGRAANGETGGEEDSTGGDDEEEVS